MDFQTPMPKYVLLGSTALYLEKQTDEHMGRYYREAGAWSITIYRNPEGVMRAIHEKPFPEYIAETPVSICTAEQHAVSNGR